jgi:hypothetical protein
MQYSRQNGVASATRFHPALIGGARRATAPPDGEQPGISACSEIPALHVIRVHAHAPRPSKEFRMRIDSICIPLGRAKRSAHTAVTDA